jgi:hypothetical protein
MSKTLGNTDVNGARKNVKDNVAKQAAAKGTL